VQPRVVIEREAVGADEGFVLPAIPAVGATPDRAGSTLWGSRMAPAASADIRCRAWAAPTTVAADWKTSPANLRKN